MTDVSRAPSGRSSSMLPLAYMVPAALAFVLASLGVPWLAGALGGHYYQPHLVALTHTVTLGWITLTIMGACYQVIPMLLECPIWSRRLAWWELGFMVVGIVGTVGHFYLGQWSGFLWAAGLVAAGVLVHLVNVGFTLRRLATWSFTARLLVVAHVGLGLTAAFGVILGADRLWKFLPTGFFPTLHAHFHLALAGWIAPMVIGVAARIYPMFLLAREPEGRLGSAQLWGVALGVPLLVAGLLGAPPLVVPGALLVAVAAAGHVAWIVRMARSGKRPGVDWGLAFALTGTAFLPPVVVLGLGFALGPLGGPRAALAYVVLGLGGWVSLTIVGMMLKIVPFLVWYRAYGPRIGRAPVPTLAELSWPAGEGLTYLLLTIGVAGVAVAVGLGHAGLVRAFGVVLAGGGLAFAATLGRLLHHLVPCPLRRAAATSVGAEAR